MKNSNLNRPLSEMTESENGLLSEGFIVLNPEEKSAIKGGEGGESGNNRRCENNGTCSDNRRCTNNSSCSGNTGCHNSGNGSSEEEESSNE